MTILLLILLGLAFGSFVNALVWRMHEQAKPQAKRSKTDLSITKGRSVCVYCKHRLQPGDLVPVFSWLWLRGKCRYCQKPISWQYPAVELVTAVLFAVSYLAWPHDFTALGIFQLGVWLVYIVIFVALVVYDTRWMLLPDRLVFPLIGLAAVQVTVLAIWQADWQVVAGGVWGVLCLAGLFYAIFQVSGGKWIGGGDVKLGIALGLLVGGPLNSLVVLFLAALLGTFVGVPLLVTGRTALSKHIAFGPFLIVATIVVYLFGAALTGWYKRQFLLL